MAPPNAITTGPESQALQIGEETELNTMVEPESHHADRTSDSSSTGQTRSTSFDLDGTISKLLEVGRSRKIPRAFCLEPSEISAICSSASDVLLAEPSLLEISAPVKIVGDIHGQYTDLIRIFDRCGFPETTKYLFLGNYLNKGRNSLETILLLLCYKLKYPKSFFLLRGNHECAAITRVSTFYEECKYRCQVNVWKTFRTVFDSLPVAAVVSGKFFCVHGGLSPSLTDLDDIRNIARPTDVPDTGLLTDLLWSDPTDVEEDWMDNYRGVSYYFNANVARRFLQRMGLDLICRGHMAVDDGYKFDFDKSVVTVFSAPNYCGEFDNAGAVMNVPADLVRTFEVFEPLGWVPPERRTLSSVDKS
ncbi:Serine/threonine-protein phosphatase PP1 isozyme 2 [Aspergillus carlsbadensis]|nr:Serine/threonine-protein phosphatase PP1 isozyme 2 [Aspergillus carlsbadensis]